MSEKNPSTWKGFFVMFLLTPFCQPDTFIPMNILSLKELTDELQTIYDRFNNDLFGGTLAVSPFALNTRRNCIFRFDPSTFHMVMGSQFERVGLRDIMDAMLHQMCHINCRLNGISECTSNSYHNRKFREQALAVGLICGCNHHGWRKTTSVAATLTEGLREIAYPDQAVFNKREEIYLGLMENVNKGKIEGAKRDLEGRQLKKSFFLKYVCGCPGPHNSIRSGRRPDGKNRLNVICGDCLQPFRFVDEGS